MNVLDEVARLRAKFQKTWYGEPSPTVDPVLAELMELYINEPACRDQVVRLLAFWSRFEGAPFDERCEIVYQNQKNRLSDSIHKEEQLHAELKQKRAAQNETLAKMELALEIERQREQLSALALTEITQEQAQLAQVQAQGRELQARLSKEADALGARL